MGHIRRFWKRFAMAVIAGAALGNPSLAQVVPPVGGDTPRPPVAREGEELQEEVEETTQETVRSTTLRLAHILSNRVSAAIGPGGETTGEGESALVPGAQFASRGTTQLAAAQSLGGGSLSAWFSGSVTFLDNDNDRVRSDGELFLPILGLDYAHPDGWVVGLTLGYERIDLDTDFNSGELTSDGVMVVPYAGARLGQHASIDLGAGYVGAFYDREAEIGGARADSDFDGDRVIAFTNLTGYVPRDWIGRDDLILSGKTGFRYSRESQSGFREAGTRVDDGTVELGQVSLGFGVQHFTPLPDLGQLELFGRWAFNYDVIQDIDAAPGVAGDVSDDETDMTLSLGAGLSVTEDLRADLEYARTLTREDISEQSVTVGLRYSF